MRRVLILAIAAAVLAAAIVFVAIRDHRDPPCGARQVTADSPLQSTATMTEQPDPRRDALATALGAFGPVVAGVGYNYGQWLHLYGLPDGVLALSQGNPDYTVLRDGSLSPRWAVAPTRRRTAFDAGADELVLLGLSARHSTEVAAFELTTGERRWCVTSPGRHAAGDPVSTAVLEDGDVITALPDRDRIRIARLAAEDGRTRWSRRSDGVARADFIGTLGDLLVVGGSEQFRVQAARTSGSTGAPSVPNAAPAITAVRAQDGTPAWTWGRGTTAHVIGVDGDRVLVESRDAGAATTLTALDASGRTLWTRVGGATDVTLRNGVLLTRTPTRLVGRSAATGAVLWARALPTDVTFFPYGFTLDQMPSLDADHVLLPTTSALERLDLRTGRSSARALPTDGVSTTYWPYQLLVTEKLLGVVTNTAGILVARSDP